MNANSYRSAFDVDPWDAARAHYDRLLLQHVAAIMKAAGLTQIDVPFDAMVNAGDVVSIVDHPEGRFYRIRGTFNVCDATRDGVR